jgi:hypothetical protein
MFSPFWIVSAAHLPRRFGDPDETGRPFVRTATPCDPALETPVRRFGIRLGLTLDVDAIRPRPLLRPVYQGRGRSPRSRWAMNSSRVRWLVRKQPRTLLVTIVAPPF